MPSATIDQLIINSPYEEPREHWKYDRETRLFSRVAGRRPAGYVRATESSKAFDDPGVFVELPLVNKIRPRVKAWRVDAGETNVEDFGGALRASVIEIVPSGMVRIERGSSTARGDTRFAREK